MTTSEKDLVSREYAKTLIKAFNKKHYDWSENNPDNPGYIKNRTHYSEIEYGEILPSFTIEEWYGEFDNLSLKTAFSKEQQYEIIINNMSYKTSPWTYQGFLFLGNGERFGISMGPRELPFLICVEEYIKSDAKYWYIAIDIDNQTFLDYNNKVQIKCNYEKIHKLDKKYLSGLHEIYNLSDDRYGGLKGAYANQSSQVGEYAVALGYNTIANAVSSFAMGNGAEASGESSVALGSFAQAIGYAAFAEGCATKAEGNSSHAEGGYTKAIGKYSHAEGHYTQAIGEYSHAEGDLTAAIGSGAHAEGEGNWPNYTTYKFNIKLSGQANSIIYSGTVSSINASRITALKNVIISYNNEPYRIIEHKITDSDSTAIKNITITLSKTLSETEDLIDITAEVYGMGIAEGRGAHSEGVWCNALGVGAHAEGYNTVAIGSESHAEGYINVASAQGAHAEGRWNEATSGGAHAEGQANKASGWAAHAEGVGTIASGEKSHAEGDNTIAASSYQHVQGRYNIEDVEEKYAHIVGNGIAEWENNYTVPIYSNAHTLDWDGNAWFAGDVYVGSTSGTNKDEGSKKLVTEEYINKPKDYIALNDTGNGYTYFIQMRNGNLVSRCAISSIEVTKMPDKTEYVENEYLDTTGMVITATCGDGNTFEITDYTYTNESLTVGENIIEISYAEFGMTYTASIKVVAVINNLTNITVATPPSKTIYEYGETFNSDGMVITATYQDGSTKNVTGYTCSPTSLTTVGSNIITISYTEGGITKTCTQVVTVNPSISDILQDFEYTDNGNGTYTLTGWKGTTNGVASTEIILPNDNRIVW